LKKAILAAAAAAILGPALPAPAQSYPSKPAKLAQERNIRLED
jgi:hypothetical protein